MAQEVICSNLGTSVANYPAATPPALGLNSPISLDLSRGRPD